MTESSSDALAMEPFDSTSRDVIGLLAVELPVLLGCIGICLPFCFVVGPDVLQAGYRTRCTPRDTMAWQASLLVHSVFEVRRRAGVLSFGTHADRVFRPGSRVSR